jgi:hypothetical protein
MRQQSENDIPLGLTLQRTRGEMEFFDTVSKSTKKQVDSLSKLYKDSEFLEKANKEFEKELRKDVAARKKEHEQYLETLKKKGASEKQIEKLKAENKKELKELRAKSREEHDKSIKETQKQFTKLKQGVDKSLKSYEFYQQKMAE